MLLTSGSAWAMVLKTEIASINNPNSKAETDNKKDEDLTLVSFGILWQSEGLTKNSDDYPNKKSNRKANH